MDALISWRYVSTWLLSVTRLGRKAVVRWDSETQGKSGELWLSSRLRGPRRKCSRLGSRKHVRHSSTRGLNKINTWRSGRTCVGLRKEQANGPLNARVAPGRRAATQVDLFGLRYANRWLGDLSDSSLNCAPRLRAPTRCPARRVMRRIQTSERRVFDARRTAVPRCWVGGPVHRQRPGPRQAGRWACFILSLPLHDRCGSPAVTRMPVPWISAPAVLSYRQHGRPSAAGAHDASRRPHVSGGPVVGITCKWCVSWVETVATSIRAWSRRWRWPAARACLKIIV